MSLPREQKWVNSAAAGTSFTTSIQVLADYCGSVHCVCSGLDAADGWFRVKGDNSNDASNAENLTTDASTMTTASTGVLFNIDQIGYRYLVLEWDAESNTKGAINVYLTRKQRS